MCNLGVLITGTHYQYASQLQLVSVYREREAAAGCLVQQRICMQRYIKP